MRTLSVIVILVATTAGISRSVADPNLTVNADPIPASPPLVLSTSLFDKPTPTVVVPSLRIEAARVVQERYDGQWRYPEPGQLGGYDGTGIFFGHGYYRPRSKRSAALHGASMGATLLGEILLATGSPLAGVGALAAGATLDAAGADSDRDAEAARKR